MRAMILCAIVLAASSQSVRCATACSCAPPPPPKEALQAASAVFTGKVVEIKQDQNKPFAPKSVTFEVDRSFKEVDAQRVVVTTAADSAMCGYGFEQGKSYLVYCHGDKKSLSTNNCTRTKNVETAADDLKELGEGNKP